MERARPRSAGVHLSLFIDIHKSKPSQITQDSIRSDMEPNRAPSNLTGTETPNHVMDPLLVPREEGYLQTSHRMSQEIAMKSTREPKDFNGSRNAKSCEGPPPCA